MIHSIDKMSVCIGLILVTLFPVLTHASGNEQKPVALDSSYVKECGSCHVPYLPRHLNAASWNQMLHGLESHFNVDASLDETTLPVISAYLNAHARKKPTNDAEGKPVIRISQTSWFLHEHDDLLETPAPKVKSLSKCDACHTQASTGRYSESEIKIPK